MTAIKNGIKSLCRTPWKTALFSAVLILLAVLLSVSFCVYSAVSGYLGECDAYFHTVAALDYIGADYPDMSVYDPETADAVEANADRLNALIASDSVLAFEPESSAAAIIGGFHRWDVFVPNPDRAVLRIANPVYDARLGVYMAIVSETYYSQKDYTNKLIMVRVDDAYLPDNAPLQMNKAYVVTGQYFQGSTPNPWFLVSSASFREAGRTVWLPAITDTDADETLCDVYIRYAERLRLQNDCCRVQYTASIEDVLPFQQQERTLSQGRVFTEREYADRAHVCILPDRIAGAIGVGVGDRIELAVYRSDGLYHDPDTWTETDAGAYEIVGVYMDTDDDPYRVYLPDANAATNAVMPVTGYRLGTFRLKNDGADTFLEQASALNESGFRITVYDQGYAAATEPMKELMFLSIVFLAVALLLAVAVHLLQSYLFVSRQRDAALTMRALGGGRGHVLLYYLGAALLLAVVSAAIGCGIGKLLEQRTIAVLQRFATQFADRDLRYSSGRLSLIRTLAFEPSIPIGVYLRAALTLIAGSALFTAPVTARSLHKGQTDRKRRRIVLSKLPKREAKRTKLSGVLKYGMLSMRRGVVRTSAILLLCLIAAGFFGRLTASLDGYRKQLAAYRDNAVISGFATDITGQMTDGLLIPEENEQALLRSGLIVESCVTDTIAHCSIVGAVRRADGTDCALPDYEIPTNEFALAGLEYNLSQGMRWVDASSVADSPVFHYAKDKDIRWLDGYSDASFRSNLAILAMPERLMEENELSLGDVVRILYDGAGLALGTADVRIVASYASAAPKPILFSPVGYDPRFDTDFGDEDGTAAEPVGEPAEEPNSDEAITPETEDGATVTTEEWMETLGLSATEDFSLILSAHTESGAIARRNLDSFRFTLDTTEHLDALRQALEDAGFARVRSGERGKPFAVIEDEMYLNTTHSMEAQIQYVGVLYDALYIIAGVIGLALSWLLTLSRRKEIAVMRAMGTQPYRIVLNFAFEQAALSTAGVGLGVGLTALLGPVSTPMLWILCGAFWLIWNLATVLCLIAGLLKPSYASLTEPE